MMDKAVIDIAKQYLDIDLSIQGNFAREFSFHEIENALKAAYIAGAWQDNGRPM
jgi:hypothetical protein